MKKIITLLMLTFIVSISFAQYTPMTAAGYQFKRILCDSTLHIPSFCGIPTLRNSTAKNGAIAMDTCNFKIYMWTNAAGWGEIIGAGTDTTSLSLRIDQRVKYTDTAQMLLAYLRKQDTANKWVANVTRVNDTTIRVFKGNTITDLKILGKQVDTTSLSNRIDQKLGKADSTIYYTKYRSDTSRTNIYNAINTKLSKSDSTIFYTKYRSDTSRTNIYNAINTKLSKSDSTIFYTKYRSDTSRTNIYNAINQKLNITDTTNKWVSNVTKKNDSTITIFKGTSATDIILPRGSGGSGTTPSLQDVTTVGATTSDKVTMTNSSLNVTNEFNSITGSRYSVINTFSESIGHIELNWTDDFNTSYFNPSLVMSGEGSSNQNNIILRTDEIYLQNPVKGIVSLKMQDTTEQPNLYFPRGDTQIDTLATLRDVRAGGGSSGTVTNVATGYGLSGGPITNTGTLIADTSVSGLSGKYLRITDTTGKWASASGYVPYVGATTDLDMGVHQVNAQSFYANGSNGNGHIHLKHQNSDATGQGQTTTIFADANGDFKWKNAGNFYTTLKTSGNAANAIYTFPSATTTLIGAGDTATMLTPYIRLAGTGLTKSSQTLSNNLSTGVSGGQSVVGGTAASDSLTISSTTNATKGKIKFGTSTYFENNNRLGINTSTDAGYTLDVNGTTRIQNKLTLGNSIIASASSEGTSGQVLTSAGTGATPTWSDLNSPLNAAYQALGSQIRGFNISSSDLKVTNTPSIVSQQLYLTAYYIPTSQTITGVKWYQGNSGIYTATNYNGIGLYSYSGGTLTLVASSTNDGNIWKATGTSWASKAFSSTYPATPGIYFIGFVFSGSTIIGNPTIGAGLGFSSSSNVASLDFANSAKLVSYITSVTSLTTPITMSTTTLNNQDFKIFLY